MIGGGGVVCSQVRTWKLLISLHCRDVGHQFLCVHF